MPLTPQKVRQMAEAYTAAWNSGAPEAVAAFYTVDGESIVNRGTPWVGRQAIAEMAAGFFAEVPDLRLVCDDIRTAGNHAVYFWTFTGTHAGTGNALRVAGWEEWDLDEEAKVVCSRGWYDADDYARQTAPR